MNKKLIGVTAGLIMAFAVQLPAQAMQWNTIRPGSTFHSFNLRVAAPGVCRNACLRNRYCRSWTYVKPYTLYGARPRCLLKRAIRRSYRDRCCVSGVKLRRYRRY